MEFQNKVVAITGASGGIGRELCRHFAASGATIAAVDRSDAVEAFVESLRLGGTKAVAVVVDIGQSAVIGKAFAEMASALGDIDILINNAGATKHPSLEGTTPDGFAEEVTTNLNGAYNCAYAVLPAMKARRAGVIVNIGSVNGLAALGDAACNKSVGTGQGSRVRPLRSFPRMR